MLGIEHRSMVVDDQEIHLTESKNTKKGTILHLHGFPGNPAEEYRDLRNLFATRGYRVISFNYPGLWKSGGTFSLESSLHATKTVAAHIINTYTTPPKIFAESYGGTIALNLIDDGILPSHCFYRAPLPGMQFFTENPEELQKIQVSLALLVQSGAVILDPKVELFEKEVESFSQQVKRILSQYPEIRHYLITGKNDEILDVGHIKTGYNGMKMEIWDDLSHNSIERSQWIELITKADIFYQH